MNSRLQLHDLKRLVEMAEDDEAKPIAIDMHRTGTVEFYVEMPYDKRDQFRWSPSLPNGQRNLLATPLPAPMFLRVSEHQVKSLIEGDEVTIGAFNGTGLFLETSTQGRLREEKTLISKEGHLIHAPVSISGLDFHSRAHTTPTYSVISIGLEDLVVRLEKATIDALMSKGVNLRLQNGTTTRHQANKKEPEIVFDPYDLKTTSPLVFEILKLAYQNRDVEKFDSIVERSSASLRALNSRYEKNPRPFSEKRRKHALNLINPHYVYVGSPSRPPLRAKRSIPRDPFLQTDGFNQMLQKLLYAACCWSNKFEEGIAGKERKLVDLLASLGLYDDHREDQVQSFAFFITGESLERDELNPLRRHAQK